MSDQKIVPTLYEEDRDIKITRFFEVADYLTKANLWGEVEALMIKNELATPRIIIDKNLANAVKLVFAHHYDENAAAFKEEGIGNVTILCASAPIKCSPKVGCSGGDK